MEILTESTHDIRFSPDFGQEVKAAMSMAVIKTNEYYKYQALFRQVYEQEKGKEVSPSVLAFVSSINGVDFENSGIISLIPSGKEEDRDGVAVEDPTIMIVDNQINVFHTSVEQKPNGKYFTSIGWVKGNNLEQLDVSNRKLILTPESAGLALKMNVNMVKEPEFILTKDGRWRMIYEVADGKTSRIAIAEANKLTGPYYHHRLLIDTRENKWDSQHVSPGPILKTSRGDLIMFYNGRGDYNELDKTPTWKIGYVMIDAKSGNVIEGTRSNDAIIIPPKEIGPDGQLIAFANSIIQGEQYLYYTVADKRSRVARLIINGARLAT